MMDLSFLKKSICFLLAFSYLFTQPAVIVNAFSDEQKKLYNKNILYYDIDECSNLNTQGTGQEASSSSTKELAKQMLADNGITYWTNNGVNTRDVVVAISEGKKAPTTAPDGQQKEAEINPNILKFILDAAKEGKVMVNALTDKDHSSTSNHYKGLAVDLDNNTNNTTVPVERLITIAKQYGGVKNSESSHYHFDFVKRPSGATSTTATTPSATDSSDTANPTSGSLGGINGTGFTKAEIAKAKAVNNVYKTKGIKEGTYKSTAYGPPWSAVQGTGTSSTGIPLDGPLYGVAVDPKTLPYGSMVYISPNPFNWDGPFLVMDTGGDFLGQGQKLDFYDWKGRGHQLAWGAKDVQVSEAEATDTDEEPAAAKSECACQLGSNSGVGGDVDKFIKALAQQESGGDPTQPGSSGGARGKYQYIDSTWRSSATTYYKPALQYPTANQAPESVQDAVVFLEYSKKFKDLDNDLFKLAVSHFYPVANSNPGLLDVVPPSNVITPRQYASKLINSIKDGGAWEQIPLKYQEAPEFSKYANDIDVSGASASDSTGNTLSSSLCSSEAEGDNSDGVEGVSWPVSKVLWDRDSNGFTKPHHDYPAADIPMNSGTKVYSMTEGTVQSAGSDGACGVGVFIEYQDGIVIGYCHGTPGSHKVKAGDKIRSGQQIMLSDNTGTSSGPHLHVQIKKNDVLYCPQPIFQALNSKKKVDFNELPSSGCTY